ncbi:hypothetical protein D9615_008506 [Tricholomella constricta]|uniref:Uncharacterized protein n=1 Tax=Tricholomella constricta TaxID=117010 RepID=A0A8H5H3S4_9AGAR|nr:hypothetical protein D9615_008506 [Tricholomella constricta]
MVNVTSPLPFNLHNKPRALLDIMSQGSYMSSSSRSASTSTFHESQSPNSDRHYTSRPPPLRVLSGLRITPLNSTPHSRSRSPSSAYSVASSSKDVDSDEEQGLEKHVHERPAGILGLRLVRRHDSEYGSIGRRGRAKLKKVVDGDAVECDALDLDLPEVARGRADSRDKSGAGINDGDRPSTSLKGSPLEFNEQGCSLPPQLPPQLSISPAPDTFEFRLLEVGALSASWGE